jgi:hypothetical protein
MFESPNTILALLDRDYPNADKKIRDDFAGDLKPNRIDTALRELMEKISEPRSSQVSRAAWDRLDAAAHAIEYTRGLFRFGAGNQFAAQWSSGGRAGELAALTKPVSRFAEAPAKHIPWQWKRKYDSDVRAVKMIGGGTCAYYAAVAYQYLVTNHPHLTVTAVGSKNDHAFVVIGGYNPNAGAFTEPDADLVVVDAWPTSPQPVTLADHFSGGSVNLKVKISTACAPVASQWVDPLTQIIAAEAKTDVVGKLRDELVALDNAITAAHAGTDWNQLLQSLTVLEKAAKDYEDDEDTDADLAVEIEFCAGPLIKDVRNVLRAREIEGEQRVPDLEKILAAPGIAFAPTCHKQLIQVQYTL